jgi:hypothetical protein
MRVVQRLKGPCLPQFAGDYILGVEKSYCLIRLRAEEQLVFKPRGPFKTDKDIRSLSREACAYPQVKQN